MAMANMNLIGVFVTKLWPVQALACGGGTKTIISPKFSNFGDIISMFIIPLIKQGKVIKIFIYMSTVYKLYVYLIFFLFILINIGH